MMAKLSRGSPKVFYTPRAPCPVPVGLTANYGPKRKGSQEIPTIALPPPGAALKNRGDQCASSPANRNKVIPKVITAGTRIKPRISKEEREIDSGIITAFRKGGSYTGVSS
jgi:hypothetical protein